MARFYGTIAGQATNEASRIGSKASGLRTCTMAWGGAVTVRMWATEEGVDMVEISSENHPHSYLRHSVTLYRGPVSDLPREETT